MKKRIIALLLAVCIVAPMFKVSANAASTSKVLNINWDNIAVVGNQASSSSVACGCYAIAYCRTILDGYPHTWSEYNYNSGGENNASAYWAKGNYSINRPQSRSEVFIAAYNEINAGRPLIVYVTGRNSRGNSYEHYVAIVGYTNVTDTNSLGESNFLFIDAVPGATKSGTENLGTCSRTYILRTESGKYKYMSTNSGSVSTTASGNVEITPPTISGYNVPSRLDVGQTFKLTGVISSTTNITVVSVGAFYADTQQPATYKTVYPNTTSYNLADIDRFIEFNKLPQGNYIYNVVAKNSAGRTVLVYESFTVGNVSSNAPLDLNGRLDGTDTYYLGDYGTADVYINGVLDADDCTDYYRELPIGTRYEIADIKPNPGCTYNGVVESSISGLVGEGGTYVRLDFSKRSTTRPTAPAQGIGEDFYAYIYNPHGNQNLENNGNFNVQTADVAPGDPKQIWHFLWDYQKASYKIINLYDGKCLDAQGRSDKEATNVQVYWDNGDPAQRWTLCSSSPADNMFYIIPSYITDHSLVIDVWNGHVAMPAGTNVQLGQNWYGFEGSGHFENSPFHQAQTFQINKIDDISSALGTTSKNIGDDFYGYIHFPHGNQNLENREGNVQTASIDLREPKQMWHFIWDSGKNAYKIINEYDGKYLQTSSSGAELGANVLTANDSGQAHQRWVLYGSVLDENRFFIVPSCIQDRSVTMDVCGGNVDEVPIGTNIQIYTNWYGREGYELVNGGPFHAAQTFQITKLPGAQKPVAPSAPASVTAKLDGNRMNISWTAVPSSGALDERVYELEVTQGNTQVESKTVTGTSHIIQLGNVPEAGSPYTIRVRAVNIKYQDYCSDYAQTTLEAELVTPTVTPPTASDLKRGQALSDSVLTGGAAVDPNSGETIMGTWAWSTPSVQPDASGVFQAVFIPQDNAKYNTPAVDVSVVVVDMPANNLSNFTEKNNYYEGLFRDVSSSDWFADNAASAYRLGLMKGVGEGYFAPWNNVTIAEAVTLAARLHSIYYTGEENFETYDGGNWYDPYVNYAKQNGLLSENYDYSRPATREEFVHILAQALPKEALTATRESRISFADAGEIIYWGDVELLSQAGVITGVSMNGSMYFLPGNTITRAEVAAIITRMARAELRVG